MKKIVLSIASVLAATAFAPEASAIPAFARQTNQACSACHMQHFPVLNPTGQEFKAGGYTQMGSKSKIKGEDISIPDQLNAAVLIKARYQKTNGTDTNGTVNGTTTNKGQWQIPDELSLFFGGRVAEGEQIKIGMMMENNLVGGPVGGIIAGIKIPVVVALDPVSVTVIPYLTDTLGQAYGYELSSTGMTRGVRWAEHRDDISAAQFTTLGTGAASGIAFVVQNDLGYVNLSRWSPNFAYAGGTNAVQMKSNWLRIAATPTIADWAMHIGLGVASGTNYCNANLTVPVAGDVCDTKGNVFDVQAQGALGDMETSLYFQYATAAKGTATKANHFNASTINDKKAVTVGIDVSVIPHTLHVGAALLSGNEGKAVATDTDKVKSVTLTAVYDLFQNVALHANYSMRSGDAYDVTTGTRSGATVVGGTGKSLLTLMLEAAW
jgi:hypothetical protein